MLFRKNLVTRKVKNIVCFSLVILLVIIICELGKSCSQVYYEMHGEERNRYNAIRLLEEQPYASANFYNGGYIAYEDGIYYYRSQAHNGYLCASDGNEGGEWVLAEVRPRYIYPCGEWIYFVNLCEDSYIYRIKKDGTCMEPVLEWCVDDLILLEDRLYFRSKSDEKYYAYFLDISDGQTQVFYHRNCDSLASDGKRLYLTSDNQNYTGGRVYDEIIMNLDGEEIWSDRKIYLSSLRENKYQNPLIYQDYCYYCISENNEEWLVREPIMTGEEPEKLLQVNEYFPQNYRERINFDGNYCYVWFGDMYRIDVETKEKEVLIDKKDMWLESCFVINGQVIAIQDAEDKGLIWVKWNQKEMTWDIFENREPFDKVLSGLDMPYGDGVFPFMTEQSVKDTYLAENIEYRTEADNDKHFPTVAFPQFTEAVPAYEEINTRLRTMAERFFTEAEKYYEQGYSNYEARSIYEYADEKYVCVRYRWTELDDAALHWIKYEKTILFSAQTGEELTIDDLFCVDRGEYLAWMEPAMWEYIERRGLVGKGYNTSLIKNHEFVKKFDEKDFLLTSKGVVILYGECVLASCASGEIGFEISYEYLEDMLKR